MSYTPPKIQDLEENLNTAQTSKQKLEAALAIAYGLWEIEAHHAPAPFSNAIAKYYLQLTECMEIDGVHYCAGETIRVTAPDRACMHLNNIARDIITAMPRCRDQTICRFRK